MSRRYQRSVARTEPHTPFVSLPTTFPSASTRAVPATPDTDQDGEGDHSAVAAARMSWSTGNVIVSSGIGVPGVQDSPRGPTPLRVTKPSAPHVQPVPQRHSNRPDHWSTSGPR